MINPQRWIGHKLSRLTFCWIVLGQLHSCPKAGITGPTHPANWFMGRQMSSSLPLPGKPIERNEKSCVLYVDFWSAIWILSIHVHLYQFYIESITFSLITIYSSGSLDNSYPTCWNHLALFRRVYYPTVRCIKKHEVVKLSAMNFVPHDVTWALKAWARNDRQMPPPSFYIADKSVRLNRCFADLRSMSDLLSEWSPERRSPFDAWLATAAAELIIVIISNVLLLNNEILQRWRGRVR